MKTEPLKADEKVFVALRSLYESYGYRQYTVSKFEEYDLYMQNKKFLMSEQILTFSNTNGKLMALKPDITLSIIKNTKDDGLPKKVYYSENVYRVPRNSSDFREIMQTGLECIGKIDVFAMSEVLMLAARSLETISPNYVLDISDIGIISGILSQAHLSDEQAASILHAFGEKNAHELAQICAEYMLPAEITQTLQSLLAIHGPLQPTLALVKELNLPEESFQAVQTLEAICSNLEIYGLKNIRLDFSVVNDMDYYNGIIFRGFIDGIYTGVLSGGRYDNLMAKMGKKSGAIGFAIYLDELERFLKSTQIYDIDVLVLYDDETVPAALIETVAKLVQSGKSVRAQRETEIDFTYQQCIDMRRREVSTIETDD